jgi:hypothetical protein
MTYKVADVMAREQRVDAKLDAIVGALGQVCEALNRLTVGMPIVSAPAPAQVAAPTILALPAARPADVTEVEGRFVCPRHPEHTRGEKLGFSANGIAAHVAWCKPEAK